ncbi:hypothetical protein GCK32_006151 [Trichostrongylus colubriformis]|uniref:Uncharacterized protein n=1 Tax=Trichostrongylus colubriformis TaxID=6319 RepID=A0AAN8IIR0_TRICO
MAKPTCQQTLGNIEETYNKLKGECKEIWIDLEDREQMQFPWPVNTPLEVRELVGPERFDAASPKYQMPFFWTNIGVPATPSWAMVVCLIECAFGLFCYTLNVLHFLINLFNCDDSRLPWFVFFVTMVQYSTFYSFKRRSEMEKESIREKQEKAFRRLQQKHNVTTIVIDSGPQIPDRQPVVPTPSVPPPEAPTCNGSLQSGSSRETAATQALLGKRKPPPSLKRPAKRRKPLNDDNAEELPLIPKRLLKKQKKPPVKVLLEVDRETVRVLLKNKLRHGQLPENPRNQLLNIEDDEGSC